MDKQTSDERLLKLIENSGGVRPEKRPGQTWLKKSQNLFRPRINLAQVTQKLKQLKVDLAYLNKGLMALGILATLGFLFALFSPPAMSKLNSGFLAPESSNSILKIITQEIQKNFSEKSLKRDFFAPTEIKAATNNEAEVQKENFAQLFSDLKLVGIIWSQDPEVIIESVKSGRTYSLKKGETINDQFKVKRISRGSAILEAQTKEGLREYELR